MTPEQRNCVIALAVGLLVNGAAAIRIAQLYANGSLAAPDAVNVWARNVVWVIPAAIGLNVALMLLVRIFGSDRHRPHLIDERDRKFQLYGMGVTLVAAGVGFMALLITLAVGVDTIIALNVLFFCFAAGDLLGNTIRLASYRFGDLCQSVGGCRA
ncbi:hypothetical protein [Mucisphaera sp.]|uniref:hypothetical protein n=1 Tax=Mucisphaera sp. TaxID=2913024 RepID=UPI003D14CF9B